MRSSTRDNSAHSCLVAPATSLLRLSIKYYVTMLLRGLPLKAQVFAISVCTLTLASTPSFATDLLTWNTDLGTIESIEGREKEIEKLGVEVETKTKTGKLPQIMVLEEVTSYAAAVRVAQALGYNNATIVVSNSGNDSKEAPLAEEVAIVTTEQLAGLPTSYQQFQENKPPFIVDLKSGKVSSGIVDKLEVPEQVGAAAQVVKYLPRAILRVPLQNSVVIYGVHLESSALSLCRTGTSFCKTGKDDMINPKSLNLKNAAALIEETAQKLGLSDQKDSVTKAYDAILKLICSTDDQPTPLNPATEAVRAETLQRAQAREAVAGAVAMLAATDVNEKHETVLVAGDFNTPLHEACKTGTNIKEDFEPLEGCNTPQTPKTCGTKDGFDDTFSILTSGFLGVSFKVLTEGLGRTYTRSDFVDQPIDNVLIAGPGSADKLEAIKLGTDKNGKVYGSDHYPVLVQPE